MFSNLTILNTVISELCTSTANKSKAIVRQWLQKHDIDLSALTEKQYKYIDQELLKVLVQTCLINQNMIDRAIQKQKIPLPRLDDHTFTNENFKQLQAQLKKLRTNWLNNPFTDLTKLWFEELDGKDRALFDFLLLNRAHYHSSLSFASAILAFHGSLYQFLNSCNLMH